MNSYRVIVVFVSTKAVSCIRVACRSELHIDIFTDTSRNHAFFLVTDFEIRCLGWQNVQPLRCWRVIDYSDFKCMCFINFKPCKFYNWWWCLEYTIRSYCIKHVVGSNWICSYTLTSVDKLLLNFKDILRLRNRNLIELYTCSFRQLWFIWRSEIIRISSLRIVSVSIVWNCKSSSRFLLWILHLLNVI